MKIKWGVIGCGGIADRRTIPGMMLSENSELVAVMDASLDAANRVKEKYNASYAFDNEDDLLALKEIDAVYIASPVFCHKEQAFKAAAAHKNILIEKPVGLSVSEAEEIAAKCSSEGIKIGVGFMMRFNTYHQKMREIIQSGELGEVVSARAQFTCWYPDCGAWRQNKKLSGGGAVMDMGIHCIDLVRYITNLKVSEVAAMMNNQIFNYNVEDAGSVMMHMENGAICFVDSNFNIPDNAAPCALEFYGTKGSLHSQGTLGQEECGKIIYRKADSDARYDAQQNRSVNIKEEIIELPTGNIYEKEITAFADAIINNTAVPVSVCDAIATQAVVEKAYDSSSTKSFVKM